MAAYIPENMLNEIKAGVREHMLQEAGVNKTIQKNIATGLTVLKTREDALLDKFLDGDISKEIYDAKLAKIKKEREDFEASKDKHTIADAEVIETMESIIEIAGNAGNLMKSSDIDTKRALLGLLSPNGSPWILKGQKVLVSLAKPFDVLLKSAHFKDACKTWLGQLGSNQRPAD